MSSVREISFVSAAGFVYRTPARVGVLDECIPVLSVVNGVVLFFPRYPVHTACILHHAAITQADSCDAISPACILPASTMRGNDTHILRSSCDLDVACSMWKLFRGCEPSLSVRANTAQRCNLLLRSLVERKILPSNASVEQSSHRISRDSGREISVGNAGILEEEASSRFTCLRTSGYNNMKAFIYSHFPCRSIT